MASSPRKGCYLLFFDCLLLSAPSMIPRSAFALVRQNNCFKQATFSSQHHLRFLSFGSQSAKTHSIKRPTSFSWLSSSPSSSSQIRLFGSRMVPGNPPGNIEIYDEQDSLRGLDLTRLRNTVDRIRKAIHYETYDVTLILVDDEEMKNTNLESRGIDAPTDILSFPFHEAKSPGVLEDVPFDIPDYYMLGDLIVDVPYVMRRCQEDQADLEAEQNGESNDDAEEEKEEDDDDVLERGVSGAMANVFDPELRIHMLLVHGMLHLVGHDHEEDDEYELMVTREEEILKELGMPLPPSLK